MARRLRGLTSLHLQLNEIDSERNAYPKTSACGLLPDSKREGIAALQRKVNGPVGERFRAEF